MNDTKNSPKTVAGAIANPCAELDIAIADGGGKVAIPFVDTNVIPDRNAGIGSLLRDLQNSEDPDRDGPPLLAPQFAFIDVGVSRARVAIALQTLLVRDLQMEVDYVATERPEAVPYANVTLLGADGETIRRGLSQMISAKDATREVQDWHFVVDGKGKVASLAYAYHLYGNEIWEAYFLGRTFMNAGEQVEFADPRLEAMLTPAVRQIEALIDAESDPSPPRPAWDRYRVDKHPLEDGLAAFGIRLQKTAVPDRIQDRQNVLFVGNVLNHYPPDQQVREFDRIGANLEEGDLIILQMDGMNPSFVQVFQVKGRGAQKTRERVRSINTNRLEVYQPIRGPGSWQQIDLKPEVERLVSDLMECLESKVGSPAWSQKHHRALVHQIISHVFGTFFRALPTEKTLRIAIREALRRLPSESNLKGMPVFQDDAIDAYGGALGLERSPLVSEADFSRFDLSGKHR